MPASRNTLVLYTGGTIGMQQSAEGLMPASGFASRLRDQQDKQPELALPDWQFRELLPAIDSANMNQTHWLAMVEAIRAGVEQDNCDAVLVLHGTDTLAYSAAALSFLLLGLPVPVVLPHIDAAQAALLRSELAYQNHVAASSAYAASTTSTCGTD